MLLSLRYSRIVLHPGFIFAIYCLAAIVTTLAKLAQGSFQHHGFLYQPLQNFAIFRNSFFHLIQHHNLYAAFPAEQWDFYRYSPAFALLIAPFAMVPYSLGVILWNLLNAAALFWAVRTVPFLENRAKMLALGFLFLPMLNSVQNAQSNALMAALMIAAWTAQERGKPACSSLWIVWRRSSSCSAYSRFYPAFWRAAAGDFSYTTALWTTGFALLPLLVMNFGELGTLYREWYGTVRISTRAGWASPSWDSCMPG